MDQHAAEFRVHGRVQGVGFRYYTRREARRIGVTGWVRNEADGTVLVHAEGTREQLQRMESFLREGAPAARVVSLDVRALPPTGAYSSFSVDF